MSTKPPGWNSNIPTPILWIIGGSFLLFILILIGGHGTSSSAGATPAAQPALAVSQPAPIQETSDKDAPVADGKPPKWLVKMDPEAATAQATLDKRYSFDSRREIFTQMRQRQDAEKIRIHAEYEQMPATTNLDESAARSAEEGQKIVDAQSAVFDEAQHSHHLDNDQMDALTQEAQENHWGVN